MKWNYYPHDVPDNNRPIFCQKEGENVDFYMITGSQIGGYGNSFHPSIAKDEKRIKWVYAKDIADALNTPEGLVTRNDGICWCDVKVRGMNVSTNRFGERELQIHAEPIRQKTFVFTEEDEFIRMLARDFIEAPDKTFRVKYKCNNPFLRNCKLVGFTALD